MSATPGEVRRTLAGGRLVEVSTTGRRSGLPRRVVIAAHDLDGRVYLSGRRDVGAGTPTSWPIRP